MRQYTQSSSNINQLNLTLVFIQTKCLQIVNCICQSKGYKKVNLALKIYVKGFMIDVRLVQ